jgi:hypothetical protein
MRTFISAPHALLLLLFLASSNAFIAHKRYITHPRIKIADSSDRHFLLRSAQPSSTSLNAKRRSKVSSKKKIESIVESDEFLTESEEPKISRISDEDVRVQILQRKDDLQRGIGEQLQEDIKRFETNSAIYRGKEEGNLLKSVKNAFSYVLIADFFLIIFFLGWFIAASISKEAFANPYLLERFQDIFQPVIQPALGVLMIGSVLSGVIKDDEKK